MRSALHALASATSAATHTLRARLPAAPRDPRPATCMAPCAAHRVASHSELHTACGAQLHRSQPVQCPNSWPKLTCAHSTPLLALILMICCSVHLSNPIPRLVRPQNADLNEPDLNLQLVECPNPWPKTTCAHSLPLIMLIPSMAFSTSISTSFPHPNRTPTRLPSLDSTHVPCMYAQTHACMHTCHVTHGPTTHQPVESGRPRAHDGAFGPDPSASALGESHKKPRPILSAYQNTICIESTSGAPRAPRATQSPENPGKYLMYLKPSPRPERPARTRPTPRTPHDRPSNHSLNQSQVRPDHVVHVQREHRPHPDRPDRPDGPPLGHPVASGIPREAQHPGAHSRGLGEIGRRIIAG